MTGNASGDGPQLDEVARRANVPIEFVRRLVSLGALSEDLSIAIERELGRVRLVYAWSQAGFPPETIMRLVDKKALSITFLDAPSVQGPGRLDRDYEDVASERGVPESLVERLHESIGFEPPSPHDRAGEDDLALLDVMELFRSVAVPDEAVVRLFAGLCRGRAQTRQGRGRALRGKHRGAPSDERHERARADRVRDRFRQPRLRGPRAGARHGVPATPRPYVDRALREPRGSRAGGRGIESHISQPPAICFVDLTGYTRLTEERGDRFAADVAAQLASLVKDIARRRAGSPIRWLGEGGMFHFRDPAHAVEAGLDMVEQAPAIGLPPAISGSTRDR